MVHFSDANKIQTVRKSTFPLAKKNIQMWKPVQNYTKENAAALKKES